MMKQRFIIRFCVFLAVSLVGSLILTLILHLSFSDYFILSGLILSLIYSARLLKKYFIPLIGKAGKMSCLAFMLGSVPGIIISLIILLVLLFFFPVICIIAGFIQLIAEFISAVQADLA